MPSSSSIRTVPSQPRASASSSWPEAGQEKTFSWCGEEGGLRSPTEFTVKVHWVKEKELPALDDEFARRWSATRRSLDELRERGAQPPRPAQKSTRPGAPPRALIQAAVDQAKVEIPPQMINRQAAVAVNNLAATLEGRELASNNTCSSPVVTKRRSERRCSPTPSSR